MRVCVSYVSLPSIGVDVPVHKRSPLMRETTVLCEVVCGAEPAEAPNGADFALRRDDELCAHDGESRIGVFDASESDGRTRHARRGRLHSRYRRSSGGPTSKFLNQIKLTPAQVMGAELAVSTGAIVVFPRLPPRRPESRCR